MRSQGKVRHAWMMRSIHIALIGMIAACGGGGGSGSPAGTTGATGTTGTTSSGSGSGTSTPTGTSGSTGGTGNPVTTASTANGALPTDVLMHHNDLARSGQMLAETTLTPANVNSATFGKLRMLSTDGRVDAQPLYVTNLSVAGASHNVVYVATEHGSLYAFDADTGAQLWRITLLGAGETPASTTCVDLAPEIGITSTPVIDRTRGPDGTLYAVAMSSDSGGGAHHRLHAIDLATGAELFGGPKEIAATYPGNGGGSVNGVNTFDPALHTERAALTLVGGNVYMGWTAHCMSGNYTGWMMAYSADTLAQTGVVNVTPNGLRGSVWMSGSGMASDGASLYVIDGSYGTFTPTLDAQGFPVDGNLGNTFMKLSLAPNMKVTDYFATMNNVTQSSDDEDFGSGGPLLLPDQTMPDGAVKHLALGAGKDNKIYVVDRDAMGKFNANANGNWQTLAGTLAGGIWGSAAYFNGVVYYGALNDNLKALPISNAMLATTAASKSATTFAYPGATPAISANGTTNGIVWAAENGPTGALHAYDASNLGRELYNSNQAGARDQWGAGNKFITPMIAQGRVFVGTTTGVAVFGLLK